MRVGITGGSGFIGTRLTDAFLEKGDSVVVFDVNPPQRKVDPVRSKTPAASVDSPLANRTSNGVDFYKVDLLSLNLHPSIFENLDAVIHLAGKNIFGRWNERVKQEIYQSRVMGTKNLVSALSALQHKPKVLVSASAVGYYGDRADADLYEDSGPGDNFLSRVCLDWEKEAEAAEKFGIRTVQIRTAPVLGRGGFLSKLLPIYKWGLGGPLSRGKQWFPWVHIDDIVGIYIFAIERETIKGPVNSCSPGVVRNEEFSKILALVLDRPAFFKVPKLALELVLGELGEEILASQKVRPRKLLQNGFSFKFPDLKNALENILTKEYEPR